MSAEGGAGAGAGARGSRWGWGWGAWLPVSLPLLLCGALGELSARRARRHLQGKVVMITGASSGLGEALAHSFYSKGCRVVLAARRIEELQRVKQDLMKTHPGVTLKITERLSGKRAEALSGGLKYTMYPEGRRSRVLPSNLSTVPTHPPIIIPLDLSEINELPACVSKVYDVYGHIDILINNGGVSHRGNVVNTKIDVDIKIMLVNYFGPVALTKAILPSMIERKVGHIVFVSSVQGWVAIPERSAYAASKHSLQAFADTLRAEVRQNDIGVSVISPGYIKTALSLNALTSSGEKHGVMDAATASGYTASYVADKILNAVVNKQKELIICPIAHKFAIFIRYMFPSLYFWIMTFRAKQYKAQ